MTTFDDLLAKAEAAPRPHRDVPVYLDSGISEQVEAYEQQRAELEQEIAALADDVRFGDARPQKVKDQIAELDAAAAKIQAEAAEHVVTLRFKKMAPEDWAELTARAPQRPDVAVDRLYGYDFNKVCREAAPECGVRLDGDTEADLTAEQWDRLFTVIAGHDFSRICDAIWGMNEYEPEQRLLAARKG